MDDCIEQDPAYGSAVGEAPSGAFPIGASRRPARDAPGARRPQPVDFPSMAQLTVYEKPTCTKCRELAALLTERGDRAVLARPAERALERLD